MDNNWKLFDDRFKNRRETNAPGWSSEESYQKHEAELERILDSGYVPKKGRMLELGSGAGNNCIFMAKQGWEVYGVDISPAAIAWAKETAEREGVQAVFREGDVAELKEEPDGYFDFVYDGGVSYYICGAGRKQFFANISRVLKKGGFCFIAGQHGDEKPETAMKKGEFSWDPAGRIFFRAEIPWACYPLSRNIVNEIEGAGLEVISFRRKKDEHPSDPFSAGGEFSVDCIKPNK